MVQHKNAAGLCIEISAPSEQTIVMSRSEDVMSLVWSIIYGNLGEIGSNETTAFACARGSDYLYSVYEKFTSADSSVS